MVRLPSFFLKTNEDGVKMMHNLIMARTHALADVFLTAFRSLSRADQNRIFVGMIRDKHLREDLLDLAIAESRSHDSAVPFRDIPAPSKKHHK
jgi:hypothetical protein